MRFPEIRFPSDEEIKQGCLDSYNAVCHTYMDQWSASFHELSIPSKVIELNRDQHKDLINVADGEGLTSRLKELASNIDVMLGWREHFVRLNSRSPKDITHPGLPFTCAGLQALYWLACSERSFDDLCMMYSAEKPASIYFRKYEYIPKEWELRCFAKDGILIAATQYHSTAENEYLQTDKGRSETWAALKVFYNTAIKPEMDRDIVFDVWPENKKFRLLEINPYGMSDPILFGNYLEVERGGFRIAEHVNAPV